MSGCGHVPRPRVCDCCGGYCHVNALAGSIEVLDASDRERSAVLANVRRAIVLLQAGETAHALEWLRATERHLTGGEG